MMEGTCSEEKWCHANIYIQSENPSECVKNQSKQREIGKDQAHRLGPQNVALVERNGGQTVEVAASLNGLVLASHSASSLVEIGW